MQGHCGRENAPSARVRKNNMKQPRRKGRKESTGRHGKEHWSWGRMIGSMQKLGLNAGKVQRKLREGKEHGQKEMELGSEEADEL